MTEGSNSAFDQRAACPRQSAPIRVLHVDDEVDLADLVSVYLEREDSRIEVVTETRAEAGLERLENEPVDCVVSDYDMPGMNGIEFLERVREAHSTLPFLLFTGKGSEEVASEAISAGVTDYLQKQRGTDQYAILANRVLNSVEHARAEVERDRGFQAMNAAREGIGLLDARGTFVFVNRAYADLYGYDREELVGERWGVLYPDEGVDCLDEEVLPAVADTGQWEGETTNVTKDGTRLLVDNAVARTTDGTFINLAKDVTEKRETEDELAATRRKIEHFVDAVTDYAIFTLDPDGHVTSWNQGAKRIKGYETDEILGEHFSTFYPEAQAAAGYPSELLGRAIADGSVTDRGWRLRADGTRFRADVTITAVFDDDGTHTGFIKVVKEIPTDEANATTDGTANATTDAAGTDGATDEAATDDAAVSREVLARAVDEAPIGITICGSASEGAPLVYANEGFERLTGYSEDDVLGRNCGFLQGERTDAERVAEMARGIDNADPVTVELRNYRRDGTEFWNRVTIAPVDAGSDEPAHFVGFQEDITDRKRDERQLTRQLDQFEKFGSVLSHDARTPLEVIRGRIELADETGDVVHLEKATSALERLDRLLEDVAHVMREGEIASDPSSVVLSEVASEGWACIDAPAARLAVERDGGIRADRNALARLLENLFKNAVEHGSTGPPSNPPHENADGHGGDDVSLTVTVGVCEGGFYVADDGPGVPPEKREDVFRFGFSTKDGADRSGIGLASVEQIALAHGWNVTLAEGETGGARFEFEDVETGE